MNFNSIKKKKTKYLSCSSLEPKLLSPKLLLSLKVYLRRGEGGDHTVEKINLDSRTDHGQEMLGLNENGVGEVENRSLQRTNTGLGLACGT